MGGTTIKRIEQKLEEEYKPIRKYYDDFYGEITIVQHRSTLKNYAKCEKTIEPTIYANQYLQRRVNNKNQLLVEVTLAYRVPIDMCSKNQMCIFLMNYYNTTLYHEITRRCVNEDKFQFKEIAQLFYAMVQSIRLVRQLERRNKVLFSNSSFLYVGKGKLKVLEPLLCNKNDVLQTQFQYIYSHDQSDVREHYLSPQSFSLICRKQKFKAKQIAAEESSLIFTLGMNFLQCILLADLSELYDKNTKSFDYSKLSQAQDSIIQEQGNLQKLLKSMTSEQPSRRPNLGEVKQYLQYIMQCNEIRCQDYEHSNVNLGSVQVSSHN